MSQFYVAAGDSKTGPFEVSEIKSGLLTGRFNENSLIWTQGMKGWKRLAETSLSKFLLQEVRPERQVAGGFNVGGFNVFDDRFWSISGLIWLALLGVLFVFDALFIVKDNPFAGLRMYMFMPWIFFSLTANGFLLFATVSNNEKAKEMATATAATLLMTIWLCLLVSVFWSVVSDNNARFPRASAAMAGRHAEVPRFAVVPGGVEGAVWAP